jgi:hypothetical protein
MLLHDKIAALNVKRVAAADRSRDESHRVRGGIAAKAFHALRSSKI